MFTSTCHREANTAYHLKYLERFLSFSKKNTHKKQCEDFSMSMSTFSLEANTDHFKYWRPFLELPAKHSAKISPCPCQPFIERPTLTTLRFAGNSSSRCQYDNGCWSCLQNAVRRCLHLHVWTFRRECNIDHLKLLATIPGAFGGNHGKIFRYVHVRLSWRINWAPTTWLSRWQRDTFLPVGVPTPHGVSERAGPENELSWFWNNEKHAAKNVTKWITFR